MKTSETHNSAGDTESVAGHASFANHARRRRGFSTRALVITGGTLLTLAALGSALALQASPGEPATKAGSKAPAGASGGGSAIIADQAEVSIQSFDVTTVGTGLLEAKDQKEFRNPLESETTIMELVKEGTQVKVGDLLARVNTEEIQKRLDQELLLLESSKAEFISAEQGYEIQINENESAVRKATLAVELAELDLKKFLEGEVRSKRQTLSQGIDEWRSEVKRLKEKVDQNSRLLEKGFLSKDEHQRNQLELHKAETALSKAELDSHVFESFELPREQRSKESALQEAKAELDRTKRKNESQIASKLADRENKRKQVSLREDAVNKLKKDIDSATIRATSDGLVVYGTSLLPPWHFSGNGPMAAGRKMYPNELILALPDTSSMRASVRVSESIAAKVQAGQSVALKVDALPGVAVSGTVESIGVLAERSNWEDPNLREYTVKIVLQPPYDSRLKPSMRCEAQIRLDRAENALCVPIQAIFAEGPVRYVLKSEGGKVRRVAVKLGQRSERLAAVASGLSAGDRVLVRAPLPGEVTSSPWSETELAAVGLMYAPDGSIIQQPIKIETKTGEAAKADAAKSVPIAEPTTTPAAKGEAGAEKLPG